MRHTLRLSGRFLAAMLLIATGVSNFGCGDSATVNPVVELSSLSVTTGTTTAALQPRFSRETTDYEVQLSSDVTSVTVSARPAVDGDRVTIDDQETGSRVITLDRPGTTTVVHIRVSESNTNSRTYTVKLVRAGLGGINSLKTLFISPGKLNPVFDKDEQFYRVDEIDSSVTKVTVTATPEDPIATMTVKGQDTDSGQGREITLEPAGDITIIEIFVKAQNGQVKQYHVEVPRGKSGNNDLSALTGRLSTSSPNLISFRPNTTIYTVGVGNGVASIRVTPTLDDPAATLTVTSNGPGPITTSGQTRTIPLRDAGLSTTITIRVTAQNGSEKPYTITIDRTAPPPPSGNNNLSTLTVRLSTSSPNLISFSPNTTTYTVDVGNGVASIRVTPTLDDPAATLTVTSNGPGPITISGQTHIIPLRAAGQSTTITIRVAAQNGSQKIYTVDVDRAALGGNNNLSGLTVSPGSLDSAFNANDLSYTVNVTSSVASIRVTPTLEDPAATLTVTSNGPGPITISGQVRTIPLRDAGLSTTITIRVTAQNGSQKPYTIIVDRAAPPPPSGNNNLQNLTVSLGTLSPSFSTTRARTDYAVNDVSSSATSILVTATPQDSSATVEIDRQAGNSRSIPLPTGPSTTEIEIRVIAPNNTDKTYSITVTQPAPAAPTAPTVEPDLIEEDDSCPLILNQCVVGSRNDNITNVTTPRFRIPAPGVGETPTLYSGKDQVPANFNQGDNTLQPTSALSDGEHSISYTLSNAGSESGKSPALTVTIDSAPPGNPGGG